MSCGCEVGADVFGDRDRCVGVRGRGVRWVRGSSVRVWLSVPYSSGDHSS